MRINLFRLCLFCTFLIASFAMAALPVVASDESAWAHPPLEQATSTIPQLSDSGNPCPEGQFLNLQSDACQDLDGAYGFDHQAFAAAHGGSEFMLETCTDKALQEIFDAMGPEGGVVHLPTCTMLVDGTLQVPSNVIVQGAGVGQTVLRADPEFDDTVMQVRHQKNAIIRDLSIDGSGSAHSLILAWYAQNVLIERVETYDANGSGITFRYSHQITIRYSDSYGHEEWHGISSKDCFPKEEDVSDEEECQAQFDERADEVEETPGVLWSEDFAVYSNRLHDNGSYGLDLHASEGEVAGNLMHSNGYGTKFPDASNVWIHHNHIADNKLWATFLYATVDIPERASRNIVLYDNTFGNNGVMQMRITEPVRDIYLLQNQYTGLINVRQIHDATVYVCAGSRDARIFTYGQRPSLATPEQCDLTQVGGLFDAE